MRGRCTATTMSITTETQGERTAKGQGFWWQVERIGEVQECIIGPIEVLLPRLAFDPVAKLDAIETECLHVIFRCDIAMAPGFASTRLVLIITELWHVAHRNEFSLSSS